MSDDEKFTLTEDDHKAIASHLFGMAEAKQQETSSEEGTEDKKNATELRLTDEDRKGIAAHLRELDKEEAAAAEKEKEEKKQEKKNQPKGDKGLFEQPIFSLFGGGR